MIQQKIKQKIKKIIKEGLIIYVKRGGKEKTKMNIGRKGKIR